MAFEKEKEIHPEKNPVINFIKRFIPVTNEYSDGKFFIKQSGKWAATPLFIVLIAIETTDIIFAVDSIPAILAISTDPFIVYTSNVFAILGLRALYFALAGVINLFKYLNYGLAAVLVFVGVKMLISKFVHIPVQYALGVVAGVIAISILASIIFSKKEV
jgi:tellurite resistance protein TerC